MKAKATAAIEDNILQGDDMTPYVHEMQRYSKRKVRTMREQTKARKATDCVSPTTGRERFQSRAISIIARHLTQVLDAKHERNLNSRFSDLTTISNHRQNSATVRSKLRRME